jgi:hypothetical protein
VSLSNAQVSFGVKINSLEFGCEKFSFHFANLAFSTPFIVLNPLKESISERARGNPAEKPSKNRLDELG